MKRIVAITIRHHGSSGIKLRNLGHQFRTRLRIGCHHVQGKPASGVVLGLTDAFWKCFVQSRETVLPLFTGLYCQMESKLARRVGQGCSPRVDLQQTCNQANLGFLPGRRQVQGEPVVPCGTRACLCPATVGIVYGFHFIVPARGMQGKMMKGKATCIIRMSCRRRIIAHHVDNDGCFKVFFVTILVGNGRTRAMQGKTALVIGNTDSSWVHVVENCRVVGPIGLFLVLYHVMKRQATVNRILYVSRLSIKTQEAMNNGFSCFSSHTRGRRQMEGRLMGTQSTQHGVTRKAQIIFIQLARLFRMQGAGQEKQG
mmetsp:Transcript_209/g.376  ORF Transcript_209/g.376 Transcript_209/m.376 type:complete len:313 (+) Transcript_209:307-1245(+)